MVRWIMDLISKNYLKKINSQWKYRWDRLVIIITFETQMFL